MARLLASASPIALVLTIAAAFPAVAADLTPAAPQSLPVAPVATADTPVFYATGYLWASALHGTTGTLPPLPPAEVNLSFGDILKNFDGGLMAAAEMRTGRWSFLGDVMFSQVSPDGNLPGPYRTGVELRSRSLTLQANALYRVYDGPAVDFDVGAGLRYWNLDNRVNVNASPVLPGIGYSENEAWVDPLVVGRIIARLGGPWSLTVVGDVGGFDVGSTLTWQMIGTVNYQWSEQLALRAGYRYLSVDYRAGDFLYNVQMQGPILGATYRF